MSRVRRIARLCGVAAGVLGLLMLPVVLFVPLARHGVDVCHGAIGPAPPPVPVACVAFEAPIAPAQFEGLAVALPFLIIYALASLGVAFGACPHAGRPFAPGRALLWLSTLALLIAAFAHLSLGVYFLPSGALAVLASLTAVLTAERPAPTAAPSV